MSALVATYDQISFNGGPDEYIFAIATDGDKVSIVFPYLTDDDEITEWRRAVGARLESLEEDTPSEEAPAPEDIVSIVGYNMMVNVTIMDTYQTFEDATSALKGIYSGVTFKKGEYIADEYLPLFSYSKTDTEKIEKG